MFRLEIRLGYTESIERVEYHASLEEALQQLDSARRVFGGAFVAGLIERIA
jgi:hypothetical protein